MLYKVKRVHLFLLIEIEFQRYRPFYCNVCLSLVWMCSLCQLLIQLLWPLLVSHCVAEFIMSNSLHWHLLFSLLLSWKTKVCFLFVVVHRDSKLDLKFLGLSEAQQKWEASLRQKIIFFDFFFFSPFSCLYGLFSYGL